MASEKNMEKKKKAALEAGAEGASGGGCGAAPMGLRCVPPVLLLSWVSPQWAGGQSLHLCSPVPLQ